MGGSNEDGQRQLLRQVQVALKLGLGGVNSQGRVALPRPRDLGSREKPLVRERRESQGSPLQSGSERTDSSRTSE